MEQLQNLKKKGVGEFVFFPFLFCRGGGGKGDDERRTKAKMLYRLQV